jgi:hypothetical protein
MNNQPAYFAIIPADVRYCKDLEPCARLLYGEITALSNREGYCWASNEYFSQLYEVDERTIKRWIKALEDKGFIYIRTCKKGMGWDRRIFINKEMFAKGQKCPVVNNISTPREDGPTNGFRRRDKNVPYEGTFLSPYKDMINTTSILDSDAGAVLEKKDDEEKEAFPKKCKKKHPNGTDIEITFEHFCEYKGVVMKKPTLDELKIAWISYCNCDKLVSNPIQYLMTIIENNRKSDIRKQKQERFETKVEDLKYNIEHAPYQTKQNKTNNKEQEECKTMKKTHIEQDMENKKILKELYESENLPYSEQDTSIPALAMLSSQYRRKINSPHS